MAANLTGQVRNIAEVVTGVANGDLKRKLVVEAKGEIARAREHHQRHDRHARDLRRPGDERGARSRHRRQARRPGERAGRRGFVARSHRQRESARRESDDAGARHRGSRDSGDQGRPHAIHHGGSLGRSGLAQGQHQRDDPQSQGHDAEEQRAGLAQDQHRALQPTAAGPARHPPRVEPDPVAARAAGERAPGAVLSDAAAGRRERPGTRRQLRRAESSPSAAAPEARRRPDRPVRGRKAQHAAERCAARLHAHQLRSRRSASRRASSCCRRCSKAK